MCYLVGKGGGDDCGDEALTLTLTLTLALTLALTLTRVAGLCVDSRGGGRDEQRFGPRIRRRRTAGCLWLARVCLSGRGRRRGRARRLGCGGAS